MAAYLAFEYKPEAVRVAVTHRKAVDRELSEVDHAPVLQRDELQRVGCPSLAPEAREHPSDDVERARTTMNRHPVGALLQSQRRQEAGDAEHVIKMRARQQQPIQPSETGAAR